MSWGFWLAVTCFCALGSHHGSTWVGGFSNRTECETVQRATAPTARCETRYEGDRAR